MLSKAEKRALWNAFRTKAIRLSGNCCEKCQRSASDGAILQVHHREYILGKAAWQYEFTSCEVLCKGCHARAHGKIMPNEGWSFEGDNDLEDLIGECERCGNSIRYEFFVSHPLWHDITVGTDCCDQITGTVEATERRKLIERRKSFCSPMEWKIKNDIESRKFKGVSIDILRKSDKFIIRAEGKQGKREFKDALAAKFHIHSLFEDGKLKGYLDGKK
jgi:hypothetical protein